SQCWFAWQSEWNPALPNPPPALAQARAPARPFSSPRLCQLCASTTLPDKEISGCQTVNASSFVDVAHFGVRLLIGGALVLAAPQAPAAVGARPSPGCNNATIETGRQLQRTLDVDGTARAYILDVPEGIKSKDPVPLLFDFH